MRLLLPIAMSVAVSSGSALAQRSSGAWEEAEVTGEISSSQLPEASGIAQSKADPNRLYHVNDAGSSPSFVMTNRRGSDPRTVNLDVDSFTDAEDLAVGSCPDEGSCLYIADIGDNKLKRSSVVLHVVRDTRSMDSTVSPAFSVRLTYDDGAAHNAESFAIHPSGYAYILTKESPAQFFRFPLDEIQSQREITLEKVGIVDLTPWLQGTDKPKKIVPTSMDIRPDGKQIVVLTRSAGVSFDVDLAEVFKSGQQDLNQIMDDSGALAEKLPMIQLPQSEAVTYIDGGSAILYSSEIAETGGSSAPIFRIDGRI